MTNTKVIFKNYSDAECEYCGSQTDVITFEKFDADNSDKLIDVDFTCQKCLLSTEEDDK